MDVHADCVCFCDDPLFQGFILILFFNQKVESHLSCHLNVSTTPEIEIYDFSTSTKMAGKHQRPVHKYNKRAKQDATRTI